MSRKPSDPVVLTYHGSSLRLSDIQLLQGPHWLNDQIIAFYYGYLSEIRFKNNPDIEFVTPDFVHSIENEDGEEMEKLLRERKLHDKTFIFFPISDTHATQATGIQWSIVIFSRPEKMYFYYDSWGTKSCSPSRQFVQHIKDGMHSRQFGIKYINAQHQSQNYDCGIHLLCMTDSIADYVNRYDCVTGVEPAHLDIVSGKRSEILKLIRKLGGKY